jgi:hypothetical protein
MSEIVNINCPNCGAAIQADPDYPNKMFCQYCGTPFMVKDIVHNYTTINNTVNNYNDMSSSTHEGIMGKRRAILDEITKERDYFLKNEHLYNSVKMLKEKEIPICEIKKYREGHQIEWRNVIGIIMIIIGAILNPIFFFVAISDNSTWLAFFISLLVIAGGISLSVFYNKDNDQIVAKYDRIKQELREKASAGEQELQEYYDAYGTCLVGFEYTYPDKINKVYDMINSGRVESPKEAIEIIAAEKPSLEELADYVIGKYSIAEFPKMMNELRTLTGYDTATAAQIIRKRMGA